MKSARTRREIYVGRRLPEPVLDEVFDREDSAIWRTTFLER